MNVLEVLYKQEQGHARKQWGATIGGRRIPARVLLSLDSDGYIEGYFYFDGVPLNIKLTDKGADLVRSLKKHITAVVERFYDKTLGR